jgi:hypothetical protein
MRPALVKNAVAQRKEWTLTESSTKTKFQPRKSERTDNQANLVHLQTD